jgi:regulator of protease activity HflC (stomatin/prohibitin superfamily)
MTAPEPVEYSQTAPTQLVQLSAGISEAADIFMQTDEFGRTPMVVIPKYRDTFLNWMLIAGPLVIIGGVLAGMNTEYQTLIIALSVILGLVLIVNGVLSGTRVVIPEGVYALIASSGKYKDTVQAGMHYFAPWTRVSHFVTKLAIPYQVNVRGAPTADDVRADVDATVTLKVKDPYKFVYGLTTTDFDQYFQAVCQDRARQRIREMESGAVYELKHSNTDEVRMVLEEAIAPFGIEIDSLYITSARLPPAFMASQEARRLAMVQTAEQEQQQELALRRQSDADQLARLEVVAKVERERQLLQQQAQLAEMRKKVAEVDAETQLASLARVEEAIARYPLAFEADLERMRIEIARSLAANSRAIVQVQNSGDFLSIVGAQALTAPDGAQSGVSAQSAATAQVTSNSDAEATSPSELPA